MHRTEGEDHSSNMFTDGPPGTKLEENFLNAVQEEIAYVIEQSGLTLLTAATDTRQQLKAALDAVYAHAQVAITDATYNITTTQLNGLYTITNYGAVAAVNLVLPAGVAGYKARFCVSASQYLRLTAAGAEQFRMGASTSAAGGYIRSNTPGTIWEIEWVPGINDWVVSPDGVPLLVDA